MGYLLKADDDGHYTVEIADGVDGRNPDGERARIF